MICCFGVSTHIKRDRSFLLIFVGKVGQFCPIKPGYNGGLLLREVIDKKTGAKSYAAATGAKGYRWLESEMVKHLEKEDGIDRSYSRLYLLSRPEKFRNRI